MRDVRLMRQTYTINNTIPCHLQFTQLIPLGHNHITYYIQPLLTSTHPYKIDDVVNRTYVGYNITADVDKICFHLIVF